MQLKKAFLVLPLFVSLCGAQEFCPQGLSLTNNPPKAHNPSFLEIIVG